MIVPRTKLLFWTAAVILPFALLAGLERNALAIAMAAMTGFAVLILIDAFNAPKCLAGISVSLPALIRMSKDREGKIELRIHNPRQTANILRVALGLPAEIQADQPEMTVNTPAGTEWSRFSWSCVPRRRGQFKPSAIHLECGSPLGFWGCRKKLAAESEIRVYPNLMRDRKDLSALFLRRGQTGVHAQRQLGRGRDFEKLREYVPGDSYDEIHWKATAKRGQPVTKLFQIERTQEVYVVIDSSRLSARRTPMEVGAKGSTGTASDEGNTTLERFVTAALVLGLAAEQQGDLFGLATFSDRVDKFVRAHSGKGHYNTCREALYALQPGIVTPDFDEIFTFLRLRLRRRALILFLTALDDPVLAENFIKAVELIRREHVVMVNMLQPPGVMPLFKNENLQSVDDLYDQLGGHLTWNKLREVEKVLQRKGVRFSMLSDERLSTQLVSEYLQVKQRQLL